jgi:NitT/TauT family transport system ATP-binding protein
MNQLQAENLTFNYSNWGENSPLIINHLNLRVNKGEFLCLLGPSGCGKSTLLKLLAGFLTPQGGALYYDSKEIKTPFKQGQMVFQDPSQLLPWLSVEQNILFSEKKGFTGNRKSSLNKNRLTEILTLTGLEDFKNYYPSQLSGGMKQRCALGRALYGEPDILYMDEPFVSLDAPSRSVLQKMLLNIWKKRGTTIIFVTHDIREALILSERVLIFSQPGKEIMDEQNRLPRPRMGLEESFLKEEARLYSLLESFTS